MQLLLLPGMHGRALLFNPLLEALPSNLKPRVVDYPPDQSLEYDDVYRLVENAAAECDDYLVVGESYSGPLALHLAAARPKGLCGVVLSATFVRCPRPFLKPLMGLAQGWMVGLRPWWIIDRMLLGRFCDTTLRQKLHEAIALVQPDVLAARLRSIATVDATLELRDCPVPILYLRGTEDRIVPPASLRLIQSIRPDVQVVALPAPHLVFQTQPAECAKALEAFGVFASQRANFT
jgi:pimeloyl-ACP methyl ester carboxylesterase